MTTMKLNGDVRRDVFRRVRERVIRELELEGPEDPMLPHLCLFHAYFGLLELLKTPGAPRMVLQAGTAYWPRLRHDQDDGKPETSTHFGFEWDARLPADYAPFACALGTATGRASWVPLREVHVWIGAPETRELVDFTTGLWPAACASLAGMDWPGDPPPEFFWGQSLPDGVRYEPGREATTHALTCLQKWKESRRGGTAPGA